MPAELFIHKSLLPFLLWLALCVILAGIILTALDRLKKPRPTLPVVVKTRHQDDLVTTLDALDRVIRTLEAYDLEEYHSVVQDAEQVLVEYQARLIDERIRQLLQDLPSPGFPEGLPPRIEKLLDEEAQ